MRTLVLEGGGMRGSFTAGVLLAFREAGIDYRHFDNYLGTSAGAIIQTYFLTDQLAQGKRIWETLLGDKFIKTKYGKPGFDVPYLRRVLSEIEPLNIKRLRSRKQKAFVPLCNHDTMQTDYFCINTYRDPIELLLSSIVYPFFSKPIVLDGVTYYDGGLSALIPLQKARELGSDEIWVVCNTPHGFRRKYWRYFLPAMLTLRNKPLRKLLLRRPAAENTVRDELESDSKLIVIRPEKTLPLNWLTRDEEKIKQVMGLGREAAGRLLKERKP